MYGLPLWLSNSSSSSLQVIDATFNKFLKRYLLIPMHSNNAATHITTSTIPLSKCLMRAAPSAIGALSFPPVLHGTHLSFLPDPSQENDSGEDYMEVLQSVPSSFWGSRMPPSIPLQRRNRRRLMHEIMDSNHHALCKSTIFHTHSLSSCLCTHCGEHAHPYHERFCNIDLTF